MSWRVVGGTDNHYIHTEVLKVIGTRPGKYGAPMLDCDRQRTAMLCAPAYEEIVPHRKKWRNKFKAAADRSYQEQILPERRDWANRWEEMMT